jgi:hypothetical protein
VVWIENLDVWLLSILLEVPSLLGSDQPDAVRRRLYPYPGEDEEAQAEWERNVHPELFALIADARQVVGRDLANVQPGAGGERGARLRIPPEHHAAWISALNGARLALGALHDVDAADMALEQFEQWGPREEAIAKIELLGWVQGLLVEGVRFD